MAKNDMVLLDSIIEQRMNDGLPSKDLGEVFEFFVLEQVLKDFDLSKEDLEVGWTDGEDDGGIDGFYTFINGLLLKDISSFVWPKTNASVEVWLITCRHKDSFQQAPLDSLAASVQELFDLQKEREELKGKYSPEILDARNRFLNAYRRLSITRPSVSFRVMYCSRGEAPLVAEAIKARGRQIRDSLESLFSSCTSDISYVGPSELIESYRRVKAFALPLPFLEHLDTGKGSYVLLVRLMDYWKFVSDERGLLRRYLFDSNVRDYLGSNRVNVDIAESLADSRAPDFWWLNNGVTILATQASVPGKYVQLKDIQIVNGLQTTETVFKHFQGGSHISDNRALLVKVIVTSDVVVRDRVIRATNNQSLVMPASLHATDKIQRDIEEALELHEWYYERRLNYYKNIGKPPARFVTPQYLASAVVTLVFKNPRIATRMKSKHTRTPERYNKVFSEHFPIKLWPILAGIFKAVDSFLSPLSGKQITEQFITTWRPTIAFLLVAKLSGTFAYEMDDLLRIRPKDISGADVSEIWLIASKVGGIGGRTHRPSAYAIVQVSQAISKKYGVSNVETLNHLQFEYFAGEKPKTIDVAFLDQVDAALPPQPWPQGIQYQVAKKLGVEVPDVRKAIRQLIIAGRRKKQTQGLVSG